ncbi:MAG: hypothetical protein ACLQT7_09210 [Candidatus Dormibacteria bacterium]
MIGALKALGALAAGVVALGAGQALAAGLEGSAQSLGTGQQVTAACTQDTLRVGFSTAYSSTLGADGGYAVTNVTLTDTASTPNLSACVGESYRVTLTGAGGTSLGTAAGVVPGGQSSFSPAGGLAAPVDASAISGAAVVIGG